MRKAVFLDRDGVINRQAPIHDYIKTWEAFEFLPGVSDAIRRLNKAGYLILIVTNQRGIARGMMTMETVNEINRRMCQELEREGAHIDGIYICPHEIGQCTCRKPDIGLFLKAEHDFGVDKGRSYLVGDSETDVEAGRRYGIRTILTSNLRDAVRIISEEDEKVRNYNGVHIRYSAVHRE